MVLVEIGVIHQTLVGLSYCSNWVFDTLLNSYISEHNKPTMPAPLSIKKRWKMAGLRTGGMRVYDRVQNVRVNRKAVWAMLSLYQNANGVTPGKSLERRWNNTARKDRQLNLLSHFGCTRFIIFCDNISHYFMALTTTCTCTYHCKWFSSYPKEVHYWASQAWDILLIFSHNANTYSSLTYQVLCINLAYQPL